MSTNNAVSGTFGRSDSEVCTGPAFSTDLAGPCVEIVALFDNRQAVVWTDGSPSSILLHRSLQLQIKREGGSSVLVGPVWSGQSFGCAASGAFRKASGGTDANGNLSRCCAHVKRK